MAAAAAPSARASRASSVTARRCVTRSGASSASTRTEQPSRASVKVLSSDYRKFFDLRTPISSYTDTRLHFSVDKKNQLDVTFCILYFSSNSCSTCFGQPCAHHQELTTASCYSLVLICAVAAGRWSSPVGR